RAPRRGPRSRAPRPPAPPRGRLRDGSPGGWPGPPGALPASCRTPTLPSSYVPLLPGRDAHVLPPPRLPLALVQQCCRFGRPVGAGSGTQRPAPAADPLVVLG